MSRCAYTWTLARGTHSQALQAPLGAVALQDGPRRRQHGHPAPVSVDYLRQAVRLVSAACSRCADGVTFPSPGCLRVCTRAGQLELPARSTRQTTATRHVARAVKNATMCVLHDNKTHRSAGMSTVGEPCTASASARASALAGAAAMARSCRGAELACRIADRVPALP